MKKIGFIFASMFFLLLTINACSNGMNSKIDASSMDALKKSIEEIKKDLSPDEVKKFDKAIAVLMLPQFEKSDNPFMALAQLADTASIEKNFLAAVDKKRPREVIELADRRIRERQEKELESINSEITELNTRKAAYEKSRDVLAKISVATPKFYISSSGFIDSPTIDFKVTNNTGMPLSRIFFHGTVSTPGRSVPWISEDFNYSIPGGIENGEKKHLQLTPNMFSGWGRDFDRKNSVFTVKVVNAMDAKATKIATEFSQSDEERLSSLLKSKADLELKLKE